MLRIKEAEDFGLGFNCMTRLYMDSYEEEILKDIIQVCEEYLKWFSRRTIICALRDLVKEYPFGGHEDPVPANQTERYESLIKVLLRQAVSKERENSEYRDNRYVVASVADDIGIINSFWGETKNFNRDTFYRWVVHNDLLEDAERKAVKQDETLPLKKKYVPLFYKVCNYMIEYSYGRHTYMPSTCRNFVKVNKELMADEALQDIVEYLKKRNADIPKKESIIDRIDSDNWINMQEELEEELLAREAFYMAQERGEDKRELKNLLDELSDIASLRTQKDCLHMYHQLIGVERYVTAMEDAVFVKEIVKQLEKNKNRIAEKRWEFFEKEEGHKYQKIGDGLYVRKS